ncbi:CubicO group peptidase (beta-lactamase class C family) [Devosia subaequoris]|uniref:CubicO group peptidase (Beta-lactamase class C family) n=1 Tax=Devosia subaequoris TaxID=395930 RepID=A0A7W6IN25_9HYPH|nr:serine hydrolase domain-containing protein [Devosia subaequoris]MBB4052131.1 CubicO group peptidase (beta-lactamase class C family) [Devosia subaequoris]MCP1210293.1 beta-lactamase family protein [Devosia subaequoris]
MTIKVHGAVEPGFEPVADAFASAFAARPTMGGALHVTIGGQSIVDLWAGIADERTGRTWTQDTPSVVFSCTKGLMSILIARLVQDGKLDYDAPVARYWPEFAQAGKADITVGQALAHQAGLSAPREDLTEDDIVDWNRMSAVMAAQGPLWPVGTGYAYHALTHGWLTGELVRRVTGKSAGTYFRELIADPLKAEAWIGLPDAQADRAAHLQVSAPLSTLWAEEAKKPAPNWPYKAMTLGDALPADLVTDEGGFNCQRIRAAEIPGAGGVATAKALATIWSATVVHTRGIRLIDHSVIATATRTQSEGISVFGGDPPYSRWGYGFQLDSEARRYLGDGCFGHDGAGGQVGFADPARQIGFGFVTNWMMGPEDQRATGIISALRQVI